MRRSPNKNRSGEGLSPVCCRQVHSASSPAIHYAPALVPRMTVILGAGSLRVVAASCTLTFLALLPVQSAGAHETGFRLRPRDFRPVQRGARSVLPRPCRQYCYSAVPCAGAPCPLTFSAIVFAVDIYGLIPPT